MTEQECSGCYMLDKDVLITCERCEENYICENCAGEYQFYEWVYVESTCAVCRKTICRDCLVFCHDCANTDGNHVIFCHDCLPDSVKRVECAYHIWYSCELHEKTSCGTCIANRGYTMKMAEL